MDWFFDQWLYKMGHPVFEVSQKYDAAAKKLTLNVKQIQQIDANDEYPQVDFFQTFVDIEIDEKIEKVWIKPRSENVYTFDAATEPKIVNFDHQSTLIKELKFTKSVDDLIYQMRNDKDAMGRNWAIKQLESWIKDEPNREKIKTALIETVTKDTFWHNRQDAMGVIRDIYEATNSSSNLDSATIAMLQKAVKDDKAPIRADAILMLGETEDAKYAPIYLDALNDRSYNVIDHAADALGSTDDPKAYAALVKLTNTPSWHDRIAAAGFSGLGWLADKRAFNSAHKIASDKNNRLELRTAALKVIGSAGKGEPRAYPLILDSLKRSIATNNIQGMFNALQAVINIADPRGQEAFDIAKAKYQNSANLLPVITKFETAFKEALTKK